MQYDNKFWTRNQSQNVFGCKRIHVKTEHGKQDNNVVFQAQKHLVPDKLHCCLVFVPDKLHCCLVFVHDKLHCCLVLVPDKSTKTRQQCSLAGKKTRQQCNLSRNKNQTTM
jgi:hypothetical protein